MTSKAKVLVTVKSNTSQHTYIWNGTSVASVQKVAEAHYGEDKKVTCRLLFYTNSYGAH
jgi:hypothetical protein